MAETHFNGLSPAEAERLALLAEECAEVVQIVMKTLRHGYESTHPNGGPTNRELVAEEIGDVWHTIIMMIERYDIDMTIIREAREERGSTVWQYLHHQETTDA